MNTHPSTTATCRRVHILLQRLSPLCLLLILLLAAGCDSGSSPTSPFSDAVAKLDPSSSPRIVFHVILAVDTDAPGELGRALQRDLDKMNTLVDGIAAYTGMGLQKQVYSGAQATIANVNRAVKALNPGPDDAILFYFSGHGGRTAQTSSQWPNMYLQQSGANLADLFARLRAKNSRLVLALSDSCNVTFEEAAAAESAQRRDLASTRGGNGYVRLFLESRGAIIASSSIPGEVSFANVFTDQFLRAMSSASSQSAPSWTDVMTHATRRIQTAGVHHQQPQYAVY